MPSKFYSLAASAVESDVTVLTIYDEIGFWGTEARSFEMQMRNVKTANLHVRLNSPGGNVYDGIAIHHQIKAFKGHTTIFVDGWAASITTIIAMAGKTIVMPKGTFMFIHNPLFGQTSGNAEELREQADYLDKVSKGLVAIYMARTGKDEKTVRGWMDGDTLFTAEECVACGLADTLTDAIENPAEAKWGQIAAYYPNLTTQISARAVAPVAQQKTPNTPIMTPEEIQALQLRVSTMEASHKTALATAKQDGISEANASEKKRKDGIVAIRNKYNKDGDLDGPAATALAADTTPDAFKETVMDLMQNRAAKGPMKPGASGQTPGEPDESTIDGCRALLAKCDPKNVAEKSRLASVLNNLRFPKKQ